MKAVQYSFQNGTIDSKLENRIDVGIPQNGVIDAKNMILTPYGTLIRRPGTKFVTTMPSAINSYEFFDAYFRVRMKHAKTSNATVTPINAPDGYTDYPVFDFIGTQSTATLQWSNVGLVWSNSWHTGDSFLNDVKKTSFNYADKESAPYITCPGTYIGEVCGSVFNHTYVGDNADGSGVDVNKDFEPTFIPDASCFFQDRFWLISGNVLRGSKQGSYGDFTRASVIDDDTQSVEYTLSRFASHTARWMISVGSQLVIGYDTMEVVMTAPDRWHAYTSGADTIPAGTPQFDIISTTGSSSVKVALLPHGFIHYNNGKLWAKILSSDLSGWQTSLLNASFDFPSTGFDIDIAVQTAPWTIIWFKDSAQYLWSYTLSEQLQTKGWSKHVIGNEKDSNLYIKVVGLCLNHPQAYVPNQVPGLAISKPDINTSSHFDFTYNNYNRQVLYLLVRNDLFDDGGQKHYILSLNVTQDIYDLAKIRSTGYNTCEFLDCYFNTSDASVIDSTTFDNSVAYDGFGNEHQVLMGSSTDFPEEPGGDPAVIALGWMVGYKSDGVVTLPKPPVPPALQGEKTRITSVSVEVDPGYNTSSGTSEVTFSDSYIQSQAFTVGFAKYQSASGPCYRLDEKTGFNRFFQERPKDEAQNNGYVLLNIDGKEGDRNIYIATHEQYPLHLKLVSIGVDKA